ncbi:unnamed protein product [Prorocentrum cordatum]|uniref:Uncharacterized protein n=1 Tax=Prorocentrum cordatum TaxID=2364126 RepID=A0ABN9Q2K1_9DINO|nr:unnamed protein product [Polarella glacialis]
MGEPTEKASEYAPGSKAEKVGVLVSDTSVGDVLGLENTRFCKGMFQCDPEKHEELRKQGALVGGTVDNSAEACTQDWLIGELSVEVGTQTVDQVEGEGQRQGVGSVKSDADRVPPLEHAREVKVDRFIRGDRGRWVDMTFGPEDELDAATSTEGALPGGEAAGAGEAVLGDASFSDVKGKGKRKKKGNKEGVQAVVAPVGGIAAAGRAARGAVHVRREGGGEAEDAGGGHRGAAGVRRARGGSRPLWGPQPSRGCGQLGLVLRAGRGAGRGGPDLRGAGGDRC